MSQMSANVSCVFGGRRKKKKTVLPVVRALDQMDIKDFSFLQLSPRKIHFLCFKQFYIHLELNQRPHQQDPGFFNGPWDL